MFTSTLWVAVTRLGAALVVLAAFVLAGVVAEIDLRYTTLTADGKQIFVPNSLVFSSAVTVTRLP